MRGRTVLLGTLALASGCAAPLVPHVQPADVERLAGRYPDVSLAQLRRGRALYLSRCTTCHALIQPAAYSAAEWPKHVSEMSERAHLGNDEQLVVRYLLTQTLNP
jgi:cytochrome c5